MLTNKFFISSGRLDNFNEILKKDVTFDNINSKKTGFYPLSRRYIFQETTRGGGGGVNWPPSPAVLGLKNTLFFSLSLNVFISIVGKKFSQLTSTKQKTKLTVGKLDLERVVTKLNDSKYQQYCHFCKVFLQNSGLTQEWEKAVLFFNIWFQSTRVLKGRLIISTDMLEGCQACVALV